MQRPRYRCFFLLALLFLPGAQAPSVSSEEILDLAACIERALEVSHARKAALATLEAAQAQLDEASALRLPHLELKTLLGPVPGARLARPEDPEAPLNILETTAKSRDFLNDLNLFTRTELDVVQPLYTFGKISAALAAARGGTVARKAQLLQTESELRLQIAQLYDGILLARELTRIMKEVRKKLDSAESRLKELLEKGSENVDQSDAAKLKVFRAKLDEQYNAIRKGELLAKETLEDLLEIPPDTDIALADDSLQRIDAPLLDMEHYIATALEHRPELEALRGLLLAGDAAVDLSKADFFPEIFIAGGLRAAYAPNVEDLDNPFIPQYFRTLSLGFAVGARLSFDPLFQTKRARLERMRANRASLQAKADLARVGIILEVKQRYLDVEEADRNIEAAREGYKAARSWVVSESFNYDIGVGKVKDLLEALAAFGEAKARWHQTIYDFNIGLARLRRAVGLPIVPERSEQGDLVP